MQYDSTDQKRIAWRVREVCELLNVSRGFIHQERKRKRLKFTKKGKAVFITHADLRSYLAAE
jgi:excisionase family DNA binding protein